MTPRWCTNAVGVGENPEISQKCASEYGHRVGGRVVSGDEDLPWRGQGAGGGKLDPLWRTAGTIRVREDPRVVPVVDAVVAPAEYRHPIGVRIIHGPMSSASRRRRAGGSELGPGRRAPDPAGVRQHPDIVKQRAEHAAATDSTAENDHPVVDLVIHRAVGEARRRKRAARSELLPLRSPAAAVSA